MVSEPRLSLAVLIDAENASHKCVDGLFEEIAKLGDANVRRIYGDFSKNNLKGWTEALSRHAINPHQNFATTSGKNSSDIELVIDAMDLLHSGRFEGFCLVSSDSDFTGLAKRIREQAVQVFGFGEQKKTPESLRQACHRFIYMENLISEEPVRELATPAIKPLKPLGDAKSLLGSVVKQNEAEDGWIQLSHLGNVLRNIHSDFDERNYGYGKLIELVRATDLFDLNQPGSGGWRIRRKVSAQKKQ